MLADGHGWPHSTAVARAGGEGLAAAGDDLTGNIAGAAQG